MNIENKIARLIYPEYRFNVTKIEDAIKLVKMGVGGFCLYGGSKKEIYETIKILRSQRDTPLLFAADYENGLGQWMSEATLLPSNMAICASDNLDLAYKKALITGKEAKALGVDWIFAPVIDLANNHKNPIVNLRAFSDSYQKTILFAESYLKGLSDSKVIGSLKHFPGHGDTSSDSHLKLPEINKSFEEIKDYELKPFNALINKCEAVMVAHLKINSIDKDNITSFSPKVINDLLRKELKFNGVIITDALSMKAISDENKAGVNALKAGADILLVPENPFKLYESLLSSYQKGEISQERIDFSIEKQNIMIEKALIKDEERPNLEIIFSKEHLSFVEEIAPLCLTWLKKDFIKNKKVYYYEHNKEENFKGKFFIEELKNLGIEISENLQDCEISIISSFSNPRAYSGKINLEEEEKKSFDNIIKKSKKVFMVSFGSPFIFDEYKDKVNSALCCFGSLPGFQKTAAKGLLGLIDLNGKMPVKI